MKNPVDKYAAPLSWAVAEEAIRRGVPLVDVPLDDTVSWRGLPTPRDCGSCLWCGKGRVWDVPGEGYPQCDTCKGV